MKALVYHGPGESAWQDVPDPAIVDATDAVVRVDCTTICGSDLHILKGDLPEVSQGRILGHEAVGTVEAVGAAVAGAATRTSRSPSSQAGQASPGPVAATAGARAGWATRTSPCRAASIITRYISRRKSPTSRMR